MRSLDEVNPIISSIAEIYLELSFEDVLEAYDDLDVVLDGIEEDAVKIKNIYLLWVYIIEWLTVKAAALISGYAVVDHGQAKVVLRGRGDQDDERMAENPLSLNRGQTGNLDFPV